MRRSALGIVAAFLLVIGGVSAFGGPGGEEAKQFAGVCIKSGLVLGALWLALPQITATLARAPRWALSWFVGKRKDSSPKHSSQGAPPSAQAPRQPRPRRRSNQ
jgi:hypothetical protein